MRQRLLFFSLFVLGLFLLPPLARAADAELAGTIEARLDGQTLYFPTLKSEYRADIEGDLATVTVVQTFANPTHEPLNARYLFPLNHDAAVFEMQMQIGDERVRAQIQETQQAERTFEAAKAAGKAAALLKEHRPNLFTQHIANLMPGLPITVTLRYVQTVPRVDGAYELVIPMVVGPRFQPAHAGVAPQETAQVREQVKPTVAGRWQLEQLPAYPKVQGLDLPPAIDPERVALSLRLNGGMPVTNATSDTHALAVQAKSASLWQIGLASGRTIDNRDFVLRYTLSGTKTDAGLLVHRDARGGFFSILLEPPAAPADSDVVPREMVFLLDCSGSMHGLPMEASKAFLRLALAKLRPDDHFRIIRFSDSATEFSRAPLAATPDNIRRGLDYVDALQGMGGTMMSSGIQQALGVPVKPGAKRIVTFLTDGYIGNEYEILELIQDKLGDARLYAFGVGSGVNRFLLDEIGRAGRGFARYMDPSENVERVAAELTDKLQSPVLTDIEIDWGTLQPTEVFPARIPDLFAGHSIRIQGRYQQPGAYAITIKGRSRGQQARLLLPVSLPARTQGSEAVALVWARSAIREFMYQMTLPPALMQARGQDVPAFDALKTRVTDLGLKFSLVTKWTSFVAVSEKIYNAQPDRARAADVPLPRVAGVTARAYGNNATGFVGAAGPEAGTWAGLCLILAMLALLTRRRLATQ